MIDSKNADKIRKFGKMYHRIIYKKLQMKKKNIGLDEQIPTESYISPEERQKIIDDLGLI